MYVLGLVRGTREATVIHPADSIAVAPRDAHRKHPGQTDTLEIPTNLCFIPLLLSIISYPFSTLWVLDTTVCNDCNDRLLLSIGYLLAIVPSFCFSYFFLRLPSGLPRAHAGRSSETLKHLLD